MEIPIKFPSDADVVREETARFRALSPERRVHVIRCLINTGARIMRLSPKAAFLRDYTVEQERCARQAIKEFVARHGH